MLPRLQPLPPAEGCLHRVAQKDGKLPLHYAAEKGATLEVVKLLLGAESDAATAAAADTARRTAHAAYTRHHPLSLRSSFSYPS